MPIKKSAAKALRQSKKRALRNKLVKNKLDFLSRKLRKSLTDNKLTEVQDWAKKLIKQIDKAAQKKILKKNTAARKKSRVMKRVNKLVKQKD